MNATEFLWAIGRATVFTSASALVALALVALLQVRSPRLHRAAWFLAVMPGWLLVPWTWRVEAPRAVTPAEALRAELLTTVTVSYHAPSVSVPAISPAVRTSSAQPMLMFYVSGMIAVFGVGLVRYLHFVRRLPHSLEALEPEWQHEWQRQTRALRKRRPIELHMTPELGPLLCFVPFRYLVLVPRPLWMALARPQRTAILRHELAHWRRGDLWWSLAIRALALPQWFNPLAWLAIRRFEEAGEWACDDLVSRGRRSHELAFARSLVAAADFATTTTPGTAAIQGGQLARRVRRLVSPRFKEETKMKKILVLIPLAALIAVQAVRIERVTAEETVPTSTKPSGKFELADKAISTKSDSIPPAYIIEPPDILLITPIRMAPKPPRTIRRFELLTVQAIGIPADRNIANGFEVDEDGRINLGPPYGRLKVAGLTIDEAEAALESKLQEYFDEADAGVSFLSGSNHPIVAGKYLVGPDGRVNLGSYGTLYVSGMPIDVARRAIEKRLAESLDNPKIALDIDQYNSKKYYIIMRSKNQGDNVVAAPITGNDTVLDALVLVDDALKQSSTNIWISRPSDNGAGESKILPVNWNQIVDGTSTATNYQLLAGDRLFVVNIDQAGDLSDVAEPATTSSTPAAPSPYSATAPTYLPPGYVPDRVEFNIEILEDRKSALAEYDTLRNGMPYVAVDSATIGPALRALASHGLIKKLSAPKISCNIGDSANMSTDSLEGYETPEINLRLIATRSRDQGNVVLTRLLADYDDEKRKLEFAAYGATGKTILVPIPIPKATETKRNSVYLAITPSFPVTPPATAPIEQLQFIFPRPDSGDHENRILCHLPKPANMLFH